MSQIIFYKDFYSIINKQIIGLIQKNVICGVKSAIVKNNTSLFRTVELAQGA